MRKSDISFAPVTENDFISFRDLRKSVMREHVDRQSLPWDEAAEDIYHRALFDEAGLRVILYQGKRVGFVGVNERDDAINLGRFCLAQDYQNRGIGGCVVEKILAEPLCAGKPVKLDILLMNPARRLYERLGFKLVSEDKKFAYYEKLDVDRRRITTTPIKMPPSPNRM